MRRSVLLATTTILAALTGFALLSAALAVRPPSIEGGTSVAANRAVVQRFYDAVNAALASGDSTPLAAVLAPEYAERDGAGVLGSGRPALERSIQALRETAPDLRLEAETLIAEEDRVIALVRTSGGNGPSLIGLPLDDPLLWGSVDLFRVAGDLVVERTSAGAPPTLLERLVQASVDLGSPGQRYVAALRVAFPPHGHRRAPAVDGLRLLYLEAGTLTVEVASADSRQAATDPPYLAKLAAGDHLIVPNGVAYSVRNLDSEPALLLDVLAPASTATRDAAAPVAEGVAATVLAGGQAATVTPGPAVLTVGRATLAPGAHLEWSDSPGPLLLAVEAGTLGLVTEGAPAWVRENADGTVRYRDQAELAVGDGALLDTQTGAVIRNVGDGPLVLLVVTLLPAVSEALS